MTSKIHLVEGSKFYMTVTDGQSYLVVEYPDEVWEPKEGEIVRIHVGTHSCIGFYTHRRGFYATSGLSGTTLFINNGLSILFLHPPKKTKTVYLPH